MEEGQAHNNWPWRSIWKTIAPLEVSCFSWLVARKACLTHDNLQKRGVQLSSRCFLCQERDEDINHLFLHCKEKYGPKGQGKASNGTPAKPNNDSKQKPDVDINVGLSDRPPWFCSLCNTNATSKQTLLLHADGKKHRAKARAFHAAKQQPKQTELASHGVEVSSDNIRKSEIPENKAGEELNEQNSREAKNGNSQSKKKRKDRESENGGAKLSAELDNGEVIQVEKEQETKHKKKAKNEAVGEDKAAVGGSNEKDSKKKIKWKRLITSALKSNSDGALKLKKLKKIVMKSANEWGIVEDESQVSDMIEHKINSSSRFVVDGKYVRLAAKN